MVTMYVACAAIERVDRRELTINFSYRYLFGVHRTFGAMLFRCQYGDTAMIFQDLRGIGEGWPAVHQAPLPTSSNPHQIPMLYSTIKQRIPLYQ